MKSNLLLVIFSICALTQAQDVKSYAFFAKNVPPIPGENCHSQANQLALKFSRITGQNASGTCKTIRPDGYDILIRYQALEFLEPVSSVPDLDFPGRGYEFNTQRECEAHLAQESAVFEKNMGLEPILAFCHSRENYYGLRRWALILQGFGRKKTTLAWSSSYVPGRPSAEQIESIKKSVKEKLTQDGLEVRFGFIQNRDQGGLRLNALYYGQYGEQLKGFSLASVNSLEQCFLALHEFQVMEKDHPEVRTVASCIHNPFRHGADLFLVANVLKGFGYQHAAESFTSYEDCQRHKNRLVDFYKKEVSPSVLEGFCTEWGPEWKINLIQKVG